MPDFGIFRGFNDKLFGDKLVAGQLPINLGLIGSTNFSGFDPDAEAFFDRVTAAGGTLSATEKTAVDTLVKQMKLDGIWTLMKAIYPMVGASAAACAQNLKSSSFTGTFSSGWTFASTGVTPNGTSAYMDTNLNWRNNTDLDNASFGAYWRNWNGALDNGKYYGAYDASGISLIRGLAAGNSDSYMNGFTFISVINGNGFHGLSRKSSTQLDFYRNTNIKLNATSVSSAKVNLNLYLASANSFGGFNYYEHAFAYISEGLTTTNWDNFYTAVQAFQTTLSRNV